MSDGLSFTPGDAKWVALREQCKDLFFFATTILGYANFFPCLPETHLLYCRFIQRKTGIPDIDNAPWQLCMTPRGTGKSALGTIASSIQEVCFNPNTSIMIANEKAQLAEDFLATIKGNFAGNDLLRALFPEVCPTEEELKSLTWKTDAATVKRTSNRPEPTFFTIGVGGTRIGMHPDGIIIDDPISKEAMENARVGAWQIMDRVNRWHNEQKLLLNTQAKPFPWVRVNGCIAEGQRVLIESGEWVPIEKVEVGWRVWSYDIKAKTFRPQRVKAVIPQGKHKVVTVRTKLHSLTATPDHPFLRLAERHGQLRAKGTPPVWVHAENLRVGENYHDGDRVAVLKTLPEVLPLDEHTKDFAWLLGMLWGDGFVTKYVGKTKRRGTSYGVCCAMGVEEELNSRVAESLRRHFGGRPYRTNRGTCLRMDCNSAGRILEALGLTPGVRAPYKKLPPHIWHQTAAYQRAFLRGLLDADGYDHTLRGDGLERSLFSSSSLALASGVRDLGLLCNVRPTNIFSRYRMCHPPHSPAPVMGQEHAVGLSFERTDNQVRPERVESVTEEAGEVETYDLSVEGTENFIAEGFVVHNTVWWKDDVYAHIERQYGYGEEPRTYRLSAKMPDGHIVSREVYRVGDVAVFRAAAIENGQAMYPKIHPMESLMKLQRDDPELFSCNMLQNPTDASIRTFQDAWLRYYEKLDAKTLAFKNDDGTMRYVSSDDLSKIMIVDPAFTANGQGARAAIVVVGSDFDSGKRIVLEAVAERAEPKELCDDVLNIAKRRGVTRIFIEAVAQQMGWIAFVQQRALDRQLAVSVETVKPGGRNKDVRIEGLAAPFQAGSILIHPSQLDLIREYRDYRPGARYKDLLDALAYGPELWPSMPGRGRTSSQGSARLRTELQAYYSRRGVQPPETIESFE